MLEIRLKQRPLPGKAVDLECFGTVTLPRTAAEQDKAVSEFVATAHGKHHHHHPLTVAVVKPLCFSVDPFLRCQFDDKTGVDYVAPFGIGKPIESMGVGVVESVLCDRDGDGDCQVQVNQLCQTERMAWPWRDRLYFVVSGNSADENDDELDRLGVLPKSKLRLLPAAPPFTPEHASKMLGVFGATGLTAYFGVAKESGLTMKKAKSDAGDTTSKKNKKKVVVVSSAGGGTGVIVSQLCKKHCEEDCFVIGLSGSDDKTARLEELGCVDCAINYKTCASDLGSAIISAAAAAETGESDAGGCVSLFWDSVGGDIASQVHRTMVSDGTGRIVLCGQIATYNDALASKGEAYPPALSAAEQQLLSSKGVARERYLVLKYAAEFEAAIGALMQLVFAGELLPVETVYRGDDGAPTGLAGAPAAFCAMMAGKNLGKMIVAV